MKVITENDFDKIMEEIEKSLQSRQVPIHARPLIAIPEFTTRMKIISPIPITNQKPIPGFYEGANLAAHINKWYKERYGDRLKLSMGPGSAAILIKGEPWKVNYHRQRRWLEI